MAKTMMWKRALAPLFFAACVPAGAAVGEPIPGVSHAGERLSASDWAVLERASFGASKADAERMERMGRSAWIESQLRFVGDECLPNSARARISALGYQSYDPVATVAMERTEVAAAKERGGPMEAQMAARKYKQVPIQEAFERKALRATQCSQPLQERMADFWTNHFNVYARKAQVAVMLPDYEERAIRPFVFGKFEDMAFAVMTHPAMLQYLDNDQSSKGHVNENYARELMELHTMGVKGGYTQTDVQELARILTGVGQNLSGRPMGAQGALSLPNGFSFDPNRHDDGPKVFLGRHYPAGGGFGEVRQALTQLASHPSTARFLSQRMVQYFIADEPPAGLVADMAQAYLKSGGSLAAMSGVMIRSPEFADPHLTKFKEPQDWVFSAMRLQYGADEIVNARPLYKWMSDLGQAPYMKLTPDGYAHTTSEWASADQLGKRFEIARQLVGAPGALFLPAPSEGSKPDQRSRAEAGRAFPSDPSGLWSVGWRYSSPGLAEAIKMANGDKEARALVLASPEFMRK